jgi:predicted ABC-class ATPase
MAIANIGRYQVVLTSSQVDSINLSKKRPSNVDQWQDNMRKIRRNSGQNYVSRSGEEHEEIDPPNVVCEGFLYFNVTFLHKYL